MPSADKRISSGRANQNRRGEGKPSLSPRLSLENMGWPNNYLMTFRPLKNRHKQSELFR